MRLILLTALPALLIAVLYVALLGYRRDYVGHFSAGYGGTLGGVLLVLAAQTRQRVGSGSPSSQEFGPMLPAQVVTTCVACIGLGAVFEATVFRFSKFDEVDFCNQSLGAVLAGLAVLAAVRDSRPNATAYFAGLAIATLYLGAGFYYAFS